MKRCACCGERLDTAVVAGLDVCFLCFSQSSAAQKETASQLVSEVAPAMAVTTFTVDFGVALWKLK